MTFHAFHSSFSTSLFPVDLRLQDKLPGPAEYRGKGRELWMCVCVCLLGLASSIWHTRGNLINIGPPGNAGHCQRNYHDILLLLPPHAASSYAFSWCRYTRSRGGLPAILFETIWYRLVSLPENLCLLRRLTHSFLTAKQLFPGFFTFFYAIFSFLRPEHDCYAKFTSCST